MPSSDNASRTFNSVLDWARAGAATVPETIRKPACIVGFRHSSRGKCHAKNTKCTKKKIDVLPVSDLKSCSVEVLPQNGGQGRSLQAILRAPKSPAEGGRAPWCKRYSLATD